MIFFFSIPLWLAAIFITIRAFTHPKRATVSIARFMLGLIGVILIIITYIISAMARASAGWGYWVLFAISLGIVGACFFARNKLAHLQGL